MPCTKASNGATARSIMAEWNACEVCRSLAATPSASSCVRKRSISSAGPATTLAVGPLSAASERPAGKRACTWTADRRTESIDPGGKACIKAPRSATRRAASFICMTPASTAATNSPTLWPTNATGVTCSAISCRASAYSRTNVAGCVTDVGASAVMSTENMRSRRSKGSTSPKAARHSSNAARNTGSAAYRALPIPAYCAPWPGNMNTGCGARALVAPVARVGASAARNAVTACVEDDATTQPR